jgi:hypothetical protein
LLAAPHEVHIKRARFGDVPTGTRFTFDGRTYVKLRMNMARRDDEVRAVFPTDNEVDVHPSNGLQSGLDKPIRCAG